MKVERKKKKKILDQGSNRGQKLKKKTRGKTSKRGMGLVRVKGKTRSKEMNTSKKIKPANT